MTYTPNEARREAHEAIKPEKANLQSRVLSWIRSRGAWGATCDEIERDTGMSHQTASARFYELRKRREIVPTTKRKTRSGRWAVVYVAATGRRAET